MDPLAARGHDGARPSEPLVAIDADEQRSAGLRGDIDGEAEAERDGDDERRRAQPAVAAAEGQGFSFQVYVPST